ncbi:hypothetical protein FRC03_003660 [Tulasnella sp. 419]|nr:hypothetical protein FRC02_003349 [Tulasnella sp. 418]KAG8942086.1 hypothetical protein FRC03_003660 [Tulasnella sp. 419]
MLLSQLGFLLIASLVTAKPLRPRTSPTPCVYSCPSTDQAGFPLDPNAPNNSGQSGLYCDYPAVPGATGDFYCIYDPSTGALTTDNDAGLCPGNAAQNCATKRSGKRSPPKVASEPKPAYRKMVKRVGKDTN